MKLRQFDGKRSKPLPVKPVDYNATVIHKELLTPTLGIFRVKPDDPMDPFIPGQYTVLGLNHPEKGPVLRAYSIASPPSTVSDYLEFFIRYVSKPASDNPLTHLIFKLDAGDRIHMRNKTRGKFTVDHTMGVDDERLRVFVAAGTGLAPFTSIVFQHAEQHSGNPGNHAILHGSSYPIDLGYRDDLEKLMNGNGVTRYLPTISRPQEAPDWQGFTGRVETLLSGEKIAETESALGLGHGEFSAQNCTVMICGLQGTIANTMINLLDRGFVPEDRKIRNAFGIPKDEPATLFWEQYDTEPIIDLKDEALVAELAGRLRNSGIALDPSI